MKKAPNVESLFQATHRPHPEAMLSSENMRTISRHSSIAKRLRSELSSAPALSTCDRANDCRERIDRSTSLATALRLGVLGPSQFRQSPFVVMDSVGDRPKAEGRGDELQGVSVNATGVTVLRPCCVLAEVAPR